MDFETQVLPYILPVVGAFCFGTVIGWVTYRTLRRAQVSGLSDIATVIGAVGGAAVTALFPATSALFGGYCIGLLVGFQWYRKVASDPSSPDWLGAPFGGGGGRGGGGSGGGTAHRPGFADE